MTLQDIDKVDKVSDTGVNQINNVSFLDLFGNINM